MDPNQMMMPRPRSFPMWPPTSSDAMPPPQLPFLPPPNRGWKRKNPNPNSNSAAYQPPAVGDLQVQNRAKARRWFKPNNNNPNTNSNSAAYQPPAIGDLQVQNRAKARRWFKPNSNRRPFFHKPKAKAPRNTSSFIIRAKRAGGIAPLVSPSPVTPAVLPTPVISPAHDERLLSDVLAQQHWGVDGYGSMKGLIRLRPANHAPSDDDDDSSDNSGGSDVEEHVEVERRLDHDLSRFEMVYPQPGAVFQDHDELYDQNQQDDVDVHVARLEEENLTLKERLFLMEQEVGDMRRRLEAIEARFSDAAVANAIAAVENGTEVGNGAIAAAGADDAVEQALENGTDRGDADNDAVEVVALQNGTGSGAAGVVNDTEMGDATADADNTFEDSTEKGDASDNGRANKSLENGSVEPEKSGKEEESYSAGSEKNAEIGDAASAQGGQEA